MADFNQPKKLELAEHKSPPLFSLLLIVGLIISYFFYTTKHSEVWFHEHAFQADTLMDLFNSGNYREILQRVFFANFITISLWQLIFSSYFIFTFGMATETKLGPGRFLTLLILAATIPWVVQFWDVLYNPVWPLYFEHIKLQTYFFSPAFILFALAGVYTVIVPRKATHEMYVQKGKQKGGEIFNRKENRPLSEYFGFTPELFISMFVVYEIVQRAFVILPWKEMDTLGLYATVGATIIGWITGTVLMGQLKDSFSGHPLKHAAIKQYHELMDLDIGSENAIRGAARAVGLPVEQVQTWVRENKGRLHTK